MEKLKVKIDGKEYDVAVEEVKKGKLKVHFESKTYEVETSAKEAAHHEDEEDSGFSKRKVVKAPLHGTVFSVHVKPGQKVKAGSLLLKLVAMKMENDILAETGGIVRKVLVKKDQTVNKDDIMVMID